MQRTFLNQQAQAGITREQQPQKVQFEQTEYGTPAFKTSKSQLTNKSNQTNDNQVPIDDIMQDQHV